MADDSRADARASDQGSSNQSGTSQPPPPAAQQPPRSRRGFAAMDPEKQREIARKGGRASGGRPENLRGVDRRAAGRKGGHAVVDKYGPSHMAQIGRKGGQSSGGFARMDPERQREIAARGGRGGASHAGQAGAVQHPGQAAPAAMPEAVETSRRLTDEARGSIPVGHAPEKTPASTEGASEENDEGTAAQGSA